MFPEELRWKIDVAFQDQLISSEDIAIIQDSIGTIKDEETRARVKEYIRTKTDQLQWEAREKAHSALSVLLNDYHSGKPEARESRNVPPTLDGVFQGVKSEILSNHIEDVKLYLASKFDIARYKITLKDQENILIALAGKMVKNPEFSKLFGSVSGGLNDSVKYLNKGEYGNAYDSVTESVAKEGAKALEDRLKGFIDQAVLPMQQLLETNPRPVSVQTLLMNPQAIAAYKNGDSIASDISAMTEEEKRAYVTSINTEVLKYDQKILPLENLKEHGMDLVAKAPSFIADILKWILKELPFLGDILAAFLGYKDAKDAETGLDLELQARKSLSVLREFGVGVTDFEGKSRDGKTRGEIKILKDKDLSGLKWKKLKPFFEATKEEGIDTSKKDFWIGVFAGEIKGKEKSYRLPEIDERDFDDNFAGLYEKLNKFPDIRKTENETPSVPSDQNPTPTPSPRPQPDIRSADAGKSKPYADLISWNIDPVLLTRLSGVNLSNLLDGKYRAIAERAVADKRYDADRTKVLAHLALLSEMLVSLDQDSKLEGFKSEHKGAGAAFDGSFRHISSLRKEIVSTSWHSVQTEPTLVNTPVAQEEKIVSPEHFKSLRKDAIAKILSNAQSFPIALDWTKYGISAEELQMAKQAWVEFPEWAIDFDIANQRIILGKNNYDVSIIDKEGKQNTAAKLVSASLKKQWEVVPPRSIVHKELRIETDSLVLEWGEGLVIANPVAIPKDKLASTALRLMDIRKWEAPIAIREPGKAGIEIRMA